MRPSYTGRTLAGRYAIGEKLGEGAWGAVYAATQTDLGRPVAIKILHTDVALADGAILRFEREARAAAALGHPHIIQVTDFSAAPGEPPFLVMERLAGATLGKVLDGAPRLEPRRVARIAQQILAALETAHRAGLVHRDVKPDNVFLVSMPGVEDHVKLLDFGIAKLSREGQANLTETGTTLGSPAYMAPEQIRGMQLDARVDIYAVAATMYRALSGRLPFDAPTLHALLLAITEQRAQPLVAIDPSIGAELSAVVDRAMHKDPAGRFQSAAEMRAALEPFASGTPARAQSWTDAPTIGAPVPAPVVSAPPIGYVQGPPPKKGFSVGWLVAILLVIVGLPVLGFIALILAYAMMHNPPHHGTLEAPEAASSASVPSTVASTTATTPATATSAPGMRAKGGAPVAPATTPAVVVAAEAGAPAVVTVDAGAKKQWAGAVPRHTGGVFLGYEAAEWRSAIAATMPLLTPCYAATEFDPPDHQFTVWVMEVAAAGNVLSVRRKTDFAPHPKLDACVISALRTAKLPVIAKPTTIEVSLSARTRDNP